MTDEERLRVRENYRQLLTHTDTYIIFVEATLRKPHFSFWAATAPEANKLAKDHAPLMWHWYTQEAGMVWSAPDCPDINSCGLCWAYRLNSQDDLTPIDDPACIALLEQTKVDQLTDEQILFLKQRLGLPEDYQWASATHEFLALYLRGSLKELKQIVIDISQGGSKSLAEIVDKAAPIQAQLLMRSATMNDMWSGFVRRDPKSGASQGEFSLTDIADQSLADYGGHGALWYISFNELEEKSPTLGKQLRRLDSKDRYVYELASTKWLAANPEVIGLLKSGELTIDKLRNEERPVTMSYAEVLRDMGYKNKPSDKQKMALRANLFKLNNCLLWLQEVSTQKGGKEIRFRAENEKLIYGSFDETYRTKTGKLSSGYFTIKKIPLLLAYALHTRLYKSIPPVLFQELPGGKSQGNLKLFYYLLDSIAGMKFGQRSTTIRLDTLLKDMMAQKQFKNESDKASDIFSRLPDLLDHLKRCGYIGGWEAEPKGIFEAGPEEIKNKGKVIITLPPQHKQLPTGATQNDSQQ